ncbi:hypothetical protein [Haloarchaeobius litoreus]|uniref:Uncharacterized protein n=1 Tax=Haloarchaeobius litoreus TaxID=755306 RepID=A0ABD6DMA1_9EURY|nr:hypothetical protein [Haloarchaeobius litoreus]
MDTRQTFKLVGFYRLLSWLSFGIGMALVGLGFYLGLGETITILFNDFPAEFDPAIAAANPVITVVLSVVGLVVWQLGKSIALTKTMERAIAAESDDTDDEQLKSEILDVVNDQISGVEKDLRSEIRKIERDTATDDAPSAGTSVSTSTTASRSSGGSAGGSSSASGGGSGSHRSSSRSGSEQSTRSGGGSSSRSGSGDGDDDRSERATDAVSGDEKRSRRKQQSDDDDPLP